MQADKSWISSLLILVRQFQNDTGLLTKTITDKQLKAVQTRISGTKLEVTRGERLECLRIILGYTVPITTTWDLSMADAKGLLDLSDEEFQTLFVWAWMDQEIGVSI